MDITYHDVLAAFQISGAHPGGLSLTKELLKKEKLTSDTVILDAGCGTGQTASYLTNMYSCTVYAVDAHPTMVQLAREKTQNDSASVHVLNCSIEQLPFKNNTFDYILSESTISFTHVEKSLQNFRNILKQAGVLICIEMTAEEDLSQEAKTELSQFYGMNSILTEKEWMYTFQKTGFTNVKILKANTIFSELAESEIDDTSSEFNFTDADPRFIDILEKHHLLSYKYGDHLGYRVYRAT